MSIWKDHRADPPGHDATPVGAGAGIKSPMRKQDDDKLPTHRIIGKFECLSCGMLASRRDGSQWSEMLCEGCETQQPEVMNLEGDDA